MVITTKFDYGYDCWIMHANRPMKARVFGIKFTDITKLNAGWSSTGISNVHYIVRVADPIGGFYNEDIKLPEEYVFKTKYELLDSFR